MKPGSAPLWLHAPPQEPRRPKGLLRMRELSIFELHLAFGV